MRPIDTLPAFRAVTAANDNAPVDGSPGPPPIVRVPRRRPDATYASAGNVILPLRFAERMPGWTTIMDVGARSDR